MAFECPRDRELTQFVSNHIFGYQYRHVLTAIVDRYG
jgi:hypothetical protein